MKQLLIILSFYSILTWGQTDKPLSPDYRNHINLPKYSKENFPLQQTVSSSGVWTELNPKVPRVDYLGIDFINPDTGWAVGAQGAIIYSTDGGNKWNTANSPVTNVLLNVKSFNSQIILAGGFNKTIIRSINGGKNWSLIQSGGTGNLWETEVINDSTAFMCGTNSTLLKTTNYGISWQPINTGINLNYWSIDFINQDIGFVACDSGKVLKTINGGNTWTIINTGYIKHLYRIRALSETHIVAGGEVILLSLTGGNNWSISFNGPIDAIAFIDENIGFASSYASENFIKKTTDGGQSWQVQSADNIGSYGLMFVNDSTGFNAGLGLVIKKTTNAGNNWVQKIIKDDFKKVWSISENLAFAIGGGVYKTSDGGLTWNSTFPYEPGNIGLASVFFTDNLTGFVGTNSSVRIYKTTDAGETWIRKNVTGVTVLNEPIYDIFFVNTSTGYASTGGGAVIKTTDGGENWFATTNSIYGKAIQFIDSLRGYSLSGLFTKTTDGGYTWTQIPYPDNMENSIDLFFFDEQNGWIISTDQLIRTTNGGSNWRQIPEVTNFGFGYFNWPSNKRGFITGGKKSYETNDSGKTWNEITNEVGYPVRMHSGNLYSGFGVGGSGVILKYFDSAYVPVELTSFNANVEGNDVILNWITASEINNKGFYIERKTSNNNYKKMEFITGKGTSTKRNDYTYTDKNLVNGYYTYRLKQVDHDGREELSREVTVWIVSNPELFELSQNYPNPFNPNTKITFRTGRSGVLKLTVYNLLGEKIKVLFNEYAEAGKKYEIDFNSNNLPSSIYYYELNQYGKREIKKMLHIK
ncbi:MAG: YCF48-related protein [Ignavibacteriaceae bacterium]